MPTLIEALEAKRAAAFATMETISNACADVANGGANPRARTETEKAAWIAADAEIKNLDTEIEAQRHLDAMRMQTNVGNRAGALHGTNDGAGKFHGIYAAPRIEFREFDPRIAMARSRDLTTEQRREREYRAGMFVRAYVCGDARATRWCNDYGVRFNNVMTEGSNAGGGALVPAEFESMIIDNREAFGVARQFARVVSMASETKTMPKRTGGLTVYYPGENPGSDFTASDKSWTNVNLTAKKPTVLSKFSMELAEDAVIDVANDLAGEIGYAFAAAEDDALFNGDGSNTYGGIVGLRTTIVNGIGGASELLGCVDFASGHDTFSEIDTADLASLMATLPEYARQTAAWYCSSVAKALVFDRLGQAGGGNTKATIAGKGEDMYAGYPIRVSQKMPTATTDISDTAMIFFGDMSRAVLFGDRRGITIQVLRELYAAQGLLGLVGSERYDIKIADVGTTTVAGPIVAGVGE